MYFHVGFAKSTHMLNTDGRVMPADLDHVKAVRITNYLLKRPLLPPPPNKLSSLGGTLLGGAL